MNIATLPTKIDVETARFPATYEQAKVALTSCTKIDECQDWANKAEALASYAKMADDDSLRTMADRIQARAVRRMGELLKQFDGRPSNASKQTDGTISLISQKDAARSAGISERQQVTAVRIANVPAEKFEAAVEAQKPATVTALAEMGKASRSVPTEAFKKATHLIGTVNRFAEFCRENNPQGVASGITQTEIAELRSQVEVIDLWLDQFVISLGGQ